MRIPLDYYRILGLPIQATSEQLQQAHRDRTLQLPRREYSDAAIAARKELLDQSYSVLSDPEQRQAYDASFLAETYEYTSDDPLPTPASPGASYDSVGGLIDPQAPSIEIKDDQFIGALLVLHELGEYELVLKLGRPFLTNGSASLNDSRHGDPTIVFPDIVLTVALACLELGREQWQQGQYENAAEALETGQELLLREGLFIGVRGEIQADLYKLRPYRVLELLASPDNAVAERQRGVDLLQIMLQERGGIDGADNDQSGLNIDDFLRFIQQLRSYLTAEEQQVLFEAEASRPSAVATYLTVYALIARGFAERQPELICTAKQFLARLSSRQDVNLEQGVCALLLGQTELANQSLAQSQEYESITFIQEHSQDSPDLLPGLCLYTERWLRDEVFPHFRDLAQEPVSLKDYFADRQVQVYLESLPADTEVVEPPVPIRMATANVPRPPARSVSSRTVAPVGAGSSTPSAVAMQDPPQASERQANDALLEAARARIAARTSSATLTSGDRLGSDTVPMPAAERVTEPTSGGGGGSDATSVGSERRRQRRERRGEMGAAGTAGDTVREDRDRDSETRSWLSRWLLPAAFLTGVVAVGVVAAWMVKNWQSASPSTQPSSLPTVQVEGAPASPTANPSPSANAELDQAGAKQVIERWLTAKAAAMGSDHKISELDNVLLDPRLSEWQKRAEEDQRNNQHRQYKHTLEIKSVELSKSSPEKVDSDQADVTAQVTETTDYYAAEQLDSSQTDNLEVRYRLVRQDGEWKIQDWEVL